MIDSLLLHPQTHRELMILLKDPPHAVLLSGVTGSGKSTIARTLAAKYLGKKATVELIGGAYFTEIQPVNGSIGIDAIRELRKFMMLKTTGEGAIRRVAIIEDAQNMTTEAQNAFLKLLEEPPADTAIIITVDHPRHLLPTVNSRTQLVRVLPPEKTSVVNRLQSSYSSPDIERAFLLSGGAVGLLYSILADDATHPLVAQVQEAKQLYSKTTFERLATVDALSKQKDQLPGLLTAFRRISKAAMLQAIAKDQYDAAQKWHARLGAIHKAEQRVLQNANAKLVLTDLFLHL